MQVQFVLIILLYYLIPILFAFPLKETLPSSSQRQGRYREDPIPEQIIAAKEQLYYQIDKRGGDDGGDTIRLERSDKPYILLAASVLGFSAMHKSKQILVEMDNEFTSQYVAAVTGLAEDNDPELVDCVIKGVSHQAIRKLDYTLIDSYLTQQIQKDPKRRDFKFRAIVLIEYCRKTVAEKREKAQQQKEEGQRTVVKQGQEGGDQGDSTNHAKHRVNNGIFNRIVRPISSIISRLPKSDSNKSLAVINPLAGALTKAAAVRPMGLPR